MLDNHVTTENPVLRSLQFAMHGLFVVLMVIGTVRGALDTAHPALFVAGCVGLLAWYLAGAMLARVHPGGRGGPVWFAVLFAGWVGLVTLSAELSWVAFALFFLALHVLPRIPALVAVAIGTLVVILAQIARPGTATVPSILGPTLGAIVAVGISWIYAQLRRENERRRRLNAELVAAQEDLVATNDALAGAQREAGVLAERARLARDVHDTLAQGFSSIVLLSRAGLAGEPDRLTDVVRRIEATAATGLADARTVVHALTPTDLEQSPLSAALRRLVDRQGDTPRVELVIDGAERALPTAIEAALLRIAQGALSNARQHAAAGRVVLTLDFGDTDITLDVTDDGIGFDTAAPVIPSTAGGFGLRAIRERAAASGGEAIVESTPGEGTSIHARLPLGGSQ
ncbi:sensor histidine kinase [Calidifontibacter terrae]